MRPRGENVGYDRLRVRYDELAASASVMRDRIAQLEAEVNEQARLNGMGGSREAKLLARVGQLEQELSDCNGDWHATACEREFAERRVEQLEAALHQAPIARLYVDDKGAALAALYAPGLPAGQFDVYLESTLETQAEPPKCKCDVHPWCPIHGSEANRGVDAK
jgi:hypothetical protein